MSNAYKRSDKYIWRNGFFSFILKVQEWLLWEYTFSNSWQKRTYDRIYCSIRWIWQSFTIVNSCSTLYFNLIWHEMANWKIENLHVTNVRYRMIAFEAIFVLLISDYYISFFLFFREEWNEENTFQDNILYTIKNKQKKMLPAIIIEFTY